MAGSGVADRGVGWSERDRRVTTGRPGTVTRDGQHQAV